jgi:H+/Cl- antiporter ClcA
MLSNKYLSAVFMSVHVAAANTLLTIVLILNNCCTIHVVKLTDIQENQMVYYLAFGVVIIPFAFLMDVFVLNTEELVHGWRVYDYIAYQK